MAKYLAIDLDGTLFYPKSRRRLVSKKNVAFLQRFIDAGNKVVLITSRNPEFVDKVVDCIGRPVDYIALTGAVMKIDGKLTDEITLPKEHLKELLADIQENHKPIGMFLTVKDSPILVRPFIKIGPFLKRFYLGVYKSILGKYREDILVDTDEFYNSLENKTIYSCRAFFGMGKKAREHNKELNKKILAEYDDLESYWMGIILEFVPKGCNKGTKLKEYIEMVGVNKDDVYVIGDSGNDIPMLIEFNEHSFAMKHACPTVKKYAKHCVSRVYKLDKYLFERSENE